MDTYGTMVAERVRDILRASVDCKYWKDAPQACGRNIEPP